MRIRIREREPASEPRLRTPSGTLPLPWAARSSSAASITTRLVHRCTEGWYQSLTGECLPRCLPQGGWDGMGVRAINLSRKRMSGSSVINQKFAAQTATFCRLRPLSADTLPLLLGPCNAWILVNSSQIMIDCTLSFVILHPLSGLTSTCVSRFQVSGQSQVYNSRWSRVRVHVPVCNAFRACSPKSQAG